MQILMCGLDYKSTALATRERFALGEAALATCLKTLAACPEVLEATILSTCNRTELYALVRSEAGGRAACCEALVGTGQVTRAEFEQHMHTRLEAEAVAHLFRVAAGLESQVLGEGQILGQVKEALALGRSHGLMGSLLDPVFRFALAAGKRVRAETGLANGTASAAGAAVALARERLGGLAGRSALILGAGRMAALSAKHLVAHGVRELTIASRSYEPAARLAERVGGVALPFHDLHGALSQVELLLCCTDAPHHVLAAPDFARVAAERAGRPLLLLDLAVPRNLDPALASYAGVTLHDMTEFGAIADSRQRERVALVSAAEAILAEEMAIYRGWRQGVALTPAITELRSKFGSLADQELEAFLGRYAAGFSADQRALVAGLTRRLVNKLLHEPLTQLKGTSASQQPQVIRAIELLYGLDVEGFSDYYRRRLDRRRGAVSA